MGKFILFSGLVVFAFCVGVISGCESSKVITDSSTDATSDATSDVASDSGTETK